MRNLIKVMRLTTVCLVMVFAFSAVVVNAATNGICGENATWELRDDGTLTISGSGYMEYYDSSEIPWDSVSESVKSIVIENGITEIADMAFSSCINLTTVTIPSSVTYIGLEAFSGCAKLTNINVDVNNEDFASVDGVVYSKDMTRLLLYPAGKNNDTVVIPESVSSIESAAFGKNSNLKNIILSDNCKIIGNYAFAGCTNLKSITIPKSVYWIGSGAFSECTGLTDVNYTGSEHDWNADSAYVGDGLALDGDNECLKNATIHYNYIAEAVASPNTDEITVLLDNKKIEFDVPPQIINDRTMVPMRAIFESLGATVEWDGDTRTVTSKKDNTTIVLTIDNANIKVNETVVVLDTPACLIDGRTLVPARAVSEAFDLDVQWNGETRTVYITQK